MEYYQVLDAALRIGAGLLQNGGEVYRVEESIQRIFQAYGVETGEVFAIPSFIIVTISTPDGLAQTKTKRIHSSCVHLDKVDLYNQLCRNIASEKMDYTALQSEISRIENRKSYGFPLQILGGALIGLSFTLLFSGGLLDAACAAICSAFIRACYLSLNRFQMNAVFSNLVSSALSTVLALVLVSFGLGGNLDVILIGTLMNLVPGVAITNFMRDIMAGDVMSGLAKFTESFLIAASIALGTGIVLSVLNMLGGRAA